MCACVCVCVCVRVCARVRVSVCAQLTIISKLNSTGNLRQMVQFMLNSTCSRVTLVVLNVLIAQCTIAYEQYWLKISEVNLWLYIFSFNATFTIKCFLIGVQI